jgi:hypothetical protein
MSRKKAKALGLSRYYTGKPCKHGHTAQRYVHKSTCLKCEKNKRRQPDYRAKENARRRTEHYRALARIRNKNGYQRRYRAANCDAINAQARKAYNPQLRKKYQKVIHPLSFYRALLNEYGPMLPDFTRDPKHQRRENDYRTQERRKQKAREYYVRNKKHLNALSRVWYKKNRHKTSEYYYYNKEKDRIYNQKNKDRIKIRHAEYCQKHKAKINAQHRKWYLRSKEARRVKVLATRRLYSALGPQNPKGELQWLKKLRALLKTSNQIAMKKARGLPLTSTDRSALQLISSMQSSPFAATQSHDGSAPQ